MSITNIIIIILYIVNDFKQTKIDFFNEVLMNMLCLLLIAYCMIIMRFSSLHMCRCSLYSCAFAIAKPYHGRAP